MKRHPRTVKFEPVPDWRWARAKIHLCPLLSKSGQTRVRSDCPLSAKSGVCHSHYQLHWKA
jgi:hypothetical protein